MCVNLMLWALTDIGLLLAGFMAGRAVGQCRAVKALVFMPDDIFEETISLTRQARECRKIRYEDISNSEDK